MSNEVEVNPFPHVKIIKVIGPSFHVRFKNWQQAEMVQDQERQRIAFLCDTSKLPKNNPKLFQKIRVKILRPFYHEGNLLTPESGIVLMARFDAESMAALHKCEIL